jgi:hypothetical protein
MNETGDVRQVIKQRRLAGEPSEKLSDAEIVQAIIGCAKSWVPEARLLGNLRAGDIARVLESLTSQPAPSGWQQRIAAMFPYPTTQAADQCKFCGEENRHKPDCLWQNAVDALPPAPDANDPIASAVRAELQPLEDALIDAGHKLAKDGEL